MFKSNLGDRGSLLPAGIDDNGALCRTYEFKPWTVEDEIAIGEFLDKNKNVRPARFATEVLSRFIVQLGPYDFSHMKSAERCLRLSRCYVGDVLHLWFDLRRSVLGDEYKVPLVCACTTEFVYEVDLATVDEDCVADGEPVEFSHTLKHPIKVEGAPRTELVLQLMRWLSFESTPMTESAIVTKLRFIADSTKDVVGTQHNGAWPPAVFSGLSKFDLEELVARVNVMQPGPLLSIAVACPGCGQAVRRAFAWTYDPFFSALPATSFLGVPVVRSSKKSSGLATDPVEG